MIRGRSARSAQRRAPCAAWPRARSWLALGAAGFVVLPWYACRIRCWASHGCATGPARTARPRSCRSLLHGSGGSRRSGLRCRGVAVLRAAPTPRTRCCRGRAAIGFAYLFAQGSRSATADPAGHAAAARQRSAGRGAVATVRCCWHSVSPARGYFKGDAFVACSVVAVAALVALFTFYPGRSRSSSRRSRKRRRVRARRLRRRGFEHAEDLGPWLPRRRHALRRGVEHADARLLCAAGCTAARPRVRAARHALAHSGASARCACCRCCRSSRRRS